MDAEVSVRKKTIDRAIDICSTYYDVRRCPPERAPLQAVLELYQRQERYVLFRKAKLWVVNNEEFLFVFDIPHLTKGLFDASMSTVLSDGMERANIGPGHMATFLSAIFVCDDIDEDAAASLVKYKYRKNFKLTIHGWAEAHVGAISLADGRVISAKKGQELAKLLTAARKEAGV